MLFRSTNTYEIFDLQTYDSEGKPWYGDKMINAIYRDSHDLLWICTNNGIYIFDYKHNKEYWLNKESGLKNDQILSIVEDDNYTLWLGSKKGMIQIMPHMREENTYHFTCSTYDVSECVQGKVFNRNSVCRTETGDVMVGGTYVVMIFYLLCFKQSTKIS